MRTFEVRNRITGMSIAVVAVERPEQVLDKVMEESGAAIEDVAAALGKTMAEVREALEVIEQLAPAEQRTAGKSKDWKDPFALPRPRLYA